MKIYLITVSTIFLSFLPLKNSQLINLSESDKKEDFYIEIVLKLIKNLYPECTESLLESISYDNTEKSLTRYPYIIDHVGKSVNDLGDEIECLNAFSGTKYVIAYIKNNSFTNDDDNNVITFLNLTNFCIGACLPNNCIGSFKDILEKLMNSSEVEICLDISNKDEENILLKCLTYFIAAYLIVKLIFGIIRLIFFPKGYDKYAVKLLKDKGRMPSFEFNNDEKSENGFNKEKLISFNDDSTLSEYNPNFDFTSSFPFYLRVMRFLDLFNDIHFFFSRRNRYFNDNGLESLNFMKAIILYLIIFANTFNSLMKVFLNQIIYIFIYYRMFHLIIGYF